MMRRRLCVYTCMFIAGITAGYFMLEKVRPLTALAFLICIGVWAALFDIESENEVRDRSFLMLMLVAGFFFFTLSFLNYESAINEIDIITADGEEELCSYTGRVIREEIRDEYTRLYLRLDKESKGKSYTVRADLQQEADEVIADRHEELPKYTGCVVELRGNPRDLNSADNPGCFDYKRYMRSKDVAYSVKVSEIVITEEGAELKWRLRRGLIRLREGFLGLFDEESAAFLRGVVFGDKSEIEDDVLKEFNMNSTGHILAVSGLHIGFLHALLVVLSRKKKTWTASIGIIAVMTIYGEMTLWSSSTIRAVIVLSISILSVNLRRYFDLLSSLAAAALIILAFRPYMLFNTGFQMSFAAMGAIALFSKRLGSIFGDLLGVSFAVQIGTIPLIATTFYRVNILAFLINIPIIMLSSVLVPLCILMLFAYMMIGNLPVLFIKLIDFVSDALTMINHKLSFGGGFSFFIAGVGAALALSIYILIFTASSEWLRVQMIRNNKEIIRNGALYICLILLLSNIALFNTFKDDEIVFVSVGQGDSVHIRAGDKDVLIDGGGSDSINTGERILMPYLLSQGASDVDIAVLTHLHLDHYKGISELSVLYPVRSIAIPEEYRSSLEASKNNEADNKICFNSDQIIYLSGNSEIEIDKDIFIEVMWPIAGNSSNIEVDDPNEHNMVYMIHYKGVKIMVTGDLLEADEAGMLEYYGGTDRLKCDVLKVAHHGSKSSSCEAFLDAAKPEIAVIQVGRRNFYGHPHRETLSKLEERNIKVYRTDINGAVGLDIRKSGIKVDIFKGKFNGVSGFHTGS